MAKSSKGTSASSIKPVLKLAPVLSIQKSLPALSQNARDCVAKLEYLLAMARCNKLEGIACVIAMVDARSGKFQWDTEFVGILREHPLLTIGLLASLEKELLSEADGEK